MNENFASENAQESLCHELTKLLWSEKRTRVIRISFTYIKIMMSFKVNLCGHLSWATSHVVANIYHIIRTVLHVAVPVEW